MTIRRKAQPARRQVAANPGPMKSWKGHAYCQLSARFVPREEKWLVSSDLGLGEFEPSRSAADLASVLTGAFGLSSLTPDDEATDACLCAFLDSSGRSWLASWDVYTAEELVDVWDDLAQALARTNSSRLIKARIEGRHVLLGLGYRPISGDPRQLVTAACRPLFDVLAKAHAAGLVHGGINERWVSAADGMVFGFGLASLYSTWRRRLAQRLGQLVADPRFASPAELRGEPASPKADRFALAALLTASSLERRGFQGTEMPQRVLGADAFLERIVWSGRWSEARRWSGWKPGAREERRLDEALAPVSERNAPRRKWVVAAVAAIIALTFLAGGVSDHAFFQGRPESSNSDSKGPTSIPAVSPASKGTQPPSTSTPAVPPSAPASSPTMPPSPPNSPTANQEPVPPPVTGVTEPTLHALRIEGEPAGWLRSHKNVLGALAKTCGKVRATGFEIGGDIRDVKTFDTTLKSSMAGALTEIIRLRSPQVKEPILLIECGAGAVSPTPAHR